MVKLNSSISPFPRSAYIRMLLFKVLSEELLVIAEQEEISVRLLNKGMLACMDTLSPYHVHYSRFNCSHLI